MGCFGPMYTCLFYRIIKTMIYMLFLIHVETCGYYAMSAYEGIGSNRWVYNGVGNAYVENKNHKIILLKVCHLLMSHVCTISSISEHVKYSVKQPHTKLVFQGQGQIIIGTKQGRNSLIWIG